MHAGLWPYHATLRQRTKLGTSILQESEAAKDGRRAKGDIIGLSVNNLKGMFDIPGFDFVYLDIEGAEAALFSRVADLSWLSEAKVVAIKIHEKLGKYYGLEVRKNKKLFLKMLIQTPLYRKFTKFSVFLD